MADEEARCIEQVSGINRILVRDPGTNVSAIFMNREHHPAERIKVDGCLIPRGQTAADFLVSLIGVVDVIVELKGTDVRKAFVQVEATLTFLRDRELSKKHPPNSPVTSVLIVCSEYPRNNTRIERRRDRLRKMGVRVQVSTRSGREYEFSTFLGDFR